MKNFLINLSVVAAIAGAISFFASKSFPQINFELATYLCIYFFFFTAISHFAIIKVTSNTAFVHRFLLATLSKFLFSFLILLGYVFLNPESAVPFIILFASYYLLFSVFEVVCLMRFFRAKK